MRILVYINNYVLVRAMLRIFLLSFTLIASAMFSTSVSACDDKACEVAYLAETKQHTENHIRQAEAFRVERHAHSKNRERRAYALYVHIHLMLFGSDLSKTL